VGEERVLITITDKMETIRCSLRSSEPHEVKQRHADAAAYVEALFESLRNNAPVSLTHRQTVALAGRLYRACATDLEDGQIGIVHMPGEGWQRDDDLMPRELEVAYEAIVARLGRLDEAEPLQLEKVVGPIIDRVLLSVGIPAVDRRSREMLLVEFVAALRQAMDVGRLKAGGDYTPDRNSDRFPEWESPVARRRVAPMASSQAVSLKGLVDGWWREAQAAGLSASTHESYRKAVDALAKYLKHDDASLVTAADVIAFKDHLLATPAKGRALSAKTVKDSYLSGLKSVFNCAVTNRRLASNPASGITIKLAKSRKSATHGSRPKR
jgi:hypothetical protein